MKKCILVAMVMMVVVIGAFSVFANRAGGKVQFDNQAYVYKGKGTVTITANHSCKIKTITQSGEMILKPSLAAINNRLANEDVSEIDIEIKFNKASSSPFDKVIAATFAGTGDFSGEEEGSASDSATVVHLTCNLRGHTSNYIGEWVVDVYTWGIAKPGGFDGNVTGSGDRFETPFNIPFHSVGIYKGLSTTHFLVNPGTATGGKLWGTATYMIFTANGKGIYARKIPPPPWF